MRSFLTGSLKTAVNLQLFLVVWGLTAVVSGLAFFDVLSWRSVYVSISAVCYPILIIKVVLDLEIWHNRQVISAAITRGRSRLEIVCKPMFYLFLSHIIFYAGISLLFLPGGISNLAIVQHALPQAGLTAWLIYISFVTDKRMVAAIVVFIYLYVVSPFLPILAVDSPPPPFQDLVESWPAFVRSMISGLNNILPPLWSVGGKIGSGSPISFELLWKSFASILIPMVAAYRLFKTRDI